MRISQQDRPRSNGYRLEKYRLRREIDKHWVINKVVGEWNKLSNHKVSAGTVNCFQGMLDSYMDQDEMR